LHESTISRAVSRKVIQLPDGRLRPLADLFDPSLAAKEAIRQLLMQTKTPLTDQEIAAKLQSEGLPLARRTVAKYRQQLHLNNNRNDRLLYQ
jgi:RNA polymerase sigma-54 factor